MRSGGMAPFVLKLNIELGWSNIGPNRFVAWETTEITH